MAIKGLFEYKIYSFRIKLKLMSYYVYMLKSSCKKPVTYVGYTSNLSRIELNCTIMEKEQNSQKVENGN